MIIKDDKINIDYITINTKCNFQSGGRRYNTDQQSMIEIYGSLLFTDDIISQKYYNEDNPYQQDLIKQDGAKYPGMNVDTGV